MLGRLRFRLSFQAQHGSVGYRATPAGERGSALLIVFLFAAVVAIMLYMEMPVAVFEAKRQKEQLLIDRGNQYKRAVGLFVRKIGTYPANIEALESTNNMRFLRRRYKDPFTGKDDWRLLHAGPGGMLIDSKVNPTNPNGTGTKNGTNTNSNTNSLFGNSSSSSFGNSSSSFGSSSFGSSSFGPDSNSSGDPVTVPPVPQRPPAVQANGAGAKGAGEQNAAVAQDEANQNPMTPLLPNDSQQQQPGTENSQANAAPGAQPGNGQPGANGQPGPGQQGAGGNPADQNQMVQNLANNPNPVAVQGQQPATSAAGRSGPGSTLQPGGLTSATGRLNSGGLAGVASIAKGHSIKTVNDQTDYSLWEFYYDPTKDTLGRTSLATGLQQGSNSQSNSQTNTNQSAFGQNSAFGNSSSTQNSATNANNSTSTNSSTNSNTTTNPNPQLQPQ